jgi:Putative MetA-pathway of phenol degradation
MKTPHASHSLVHGILPLALTGVLTAAAPDGRLFEPGRAWLERYDSTLVASRASSEFSYESHDNDSDFYKIENSMRWGIPLQEDHALGFQFVIPVKWTETATEDASGLGDLELRTGVLGRLSPAVRYGLAVNAVFDTATDSLLSDNAFILRPIAALRWDFNAALTLGINVEYNVTPLDEDTNDVSALEVKFPLVFRINEQWSGFLSYNPRWNLLDESDRHRLDLSTTRSWGTDNEFAWSIGTEVPLASESFEFKLATGVTWFF